MGGGGGVTINFDFPAGGSCLNCSNKINLKKSSLASLARVLLINLLRLVRQADEFLGLYFCKRKSYSILGVFIVMIMLILIEAFRSSYFPLFSCLSTFPGLLFLKNVLLFLLFHSKCHTRYKYRIFPRSHRSLETYKITRSKYYFFFSQSSHMKKK